MQELGLDIEPHRRRMTTSDPPLDQRFKSPTDPLRLVFVCAMWLTGFDAPSCSTLYLDKPMRNHTLMQTMARANRVFPGKHSGLVVDYANVFVSLEKALALYGGGNGGSGAIQDKSLLVDQLRRELDQTLDWCAQQGVSIVALSALPMGGMERLQAIDDALEELKTLIAAHLSRMVQLNPTRANYQEQFEALIASYNAGSRSIDEVYRGLLGLSQQLSHEQQRHIRENLSEEELAIFDILLQSAPNLSESDRLKVKQSARELVERIKQLLVLNWQQKSSARAQLKTSDFRCAGSRPSPCLQPGALSAKM